MAAVYLRPCLFSASRQMPSALLCRHGLVPNCGKAGQAERQQPRRHSNCSCYRLPHVIHRNRSGTWCEGDFTCCADSTVGSRTRSEDWSFPRRAFSSHLNLPAQGYVGHICELKALPGSCAGRAARITRRAFVSSVVDISSSQAAALSSVAICSARAGGAGGKRDWPRWLLPVGGGSMLAGWYTEGLREELRDMYTPDSVLCVNVVEDAMYVDSSQLQKDHISSGGAGCRSCIPWSTSNSNGDVRDKSDSYKKCWFPTNSGNNHIATREGDTDMLPRGGTCSEKNDTRPTSEKAIQRWQEYACKRPGFISSRVYVHRNMRRQCDGAPMATPQAGEKQSQQWHVEHRRYLILDRWISKQAVDAALRELHTSEESRAKAAGFSALRQAQGGLPAERHENMWRQPQKEREKQQLQQDVSSWPTRQATYVFDSRQTASLWRTLC